MKYWDQLSSLESEIIKLDTLNSVVKLMAEGLTPEVEFTDIQSVFWHIEQLLSDANKSITDEYVKLFEVIRSDTQYDDFKEYNPTDTEDLSNVISQWIQTK